MDQQLQHLLAVNRAIAASLDYEELLELVVDKAAQLTGANACALLLAGEDGIARVAACRGIDVGKAKAFASPLDERINVGLRDLLAHSEDDTFLGVPVIHGGVVTGILVVHRSGPETVDPDQELLVSALADQAAIALDHAGRYRDLWRESQQARQELERSARCKDEFLAMLSHELRNPLAAIANAVAMIPLLAPADPRFARLHIVAQRQTKHMKRLLDDLLDVSRVTLGKIVLERRLVALQEVVRQAVQGLEPLIADKRHQLTVDLPAAPVVVEGDADRLVQVVSNLLANAARYTDPGGRLGVSLATAGDDAVLCVRDNGIGIAPDLLSSVFELFVQAGRETQREEGGLGIGLALVKRLTEMHGGSAEAHSGGAGAGSELVVRLPLAATGLASAETAKHAHLLAGDTNPLGPS